MLPLPSPRPASLKPRATPSLDRTSPVGQKLRSYVVGGVNIANGKVGTISGTRAAGVTADGSFMSLDGSSYLNLTSVGLYAPATAPVTLAFYSRTGTPASVGGTLRISPTGASNAFCAIRGTSPSYRLGAGYASGGTLPMHSGIGLATSNTVERTVITCANGLTSTTAADYEIWVNGTKYTTSGPIAFGAQTAGNTYLGWDGADSKFPGYIDELAVFAGALSDAEVLAYFAAPYQMLAGRRVMIPAGLTTGAPSWSTSITESVSAADSTAATYAAVAALTEAASASDSATATAVLLAAVTEAASALEAVVAAAIWNRTQADSVTSADSVTASLAGATSVIEAASAGDLLTAAAVLVASLTEAAAPAELLSTGSIYTATQADAAAAADALSAAAALVAAVSESAALADNASGVAQLVALITEQAVLADALVGTYPVTRNVSVAELVAALDLLSSSFAAIASGASWRFSVAATRRAFKVPTTGRAFAVRFTAAAVSMPPIQGTTMTCEKPQVIGPLFVGETVTASFEFARQTSAPSAPSVDVVRYSGADDPTPAALKSGAASVSGTQVLQHLTGAVAGVTYLLTAWATAPDGNRYAARQALLEVRAPS